MLEPDKGVVASKCFLTLGQLPKFSDPKQPPTKQKPFSTILQQSFLYKINIVLPSTLYNASKSICCDSLPIPKYVLVSLSPAQILQGAFFTTYIKTGSIALHSISSSPNAAQANDATITLYNGLLRLELPRDLYERAGLSGSPIPSGGRKHLKERFAVEFNLRLPAMVAGRKGFERLKRGLEAVFPEEMRFMFADLQGDAASQESPVWDYKPKLIEVQPRVQMSKAVVPLMQVRREKTDYGLQDAIFEEEVMELAEWVDLVVMQSPRVEVGDAIDPFLSRYQIPGAESGQASEQELTCVSYEGFLSSEWVRDVLALWLNAARKDPTHWLAMTGHTFRTAAVDAKLGWMVLRPPEEVVQGDETSVVNLSDAEIDSETEALKPHGKKQKEGKATKPFLQFVLYEFTAGEHG